MGDHSGAPLDLVPVSAQTVQVAAASERSFLPIMNIETALARRDAVVTFVKRIMTPDVDFGVIPGTAKPTLLKPGAEKLCSFFGLEPQYITAAEEADWTGEAHHGEAFYYVRYRCELRRDGRVVGAGEGSCNTWESKYRYRWVAEDQIPAGVDKSVLVKRDGSRRVFEYEFAIEKAETSGQYGKPPEYWKAFAEVCAAHANNQPLPHQAKRMEKQFRNGRTGWGWEISIGQVQYRSPNPDVADVINTVQKMAQKRALVAATLIATSASEFYTQDVEDTAEASSAGSQAALDEVRERKVEEARTAAASRPVAEVPAEVQKLWDLGKTAKGKQAVLAELCDALRFLIGDDAVDDLYFELQKQFGNPLQNDQFFRRIVVELWQRERAEAAKRAAANPEITDDDLPPELLAGVANA